jgi:hypothetical protein
MAIVALMLTTSGIMKLSGAENVVTLLTRAGLASYIKAFGIIELISVAIFLYPKTYKIGFLLLCCYLGGALSIELAEGQPPVASSFLVILWVSGYLKNKLMFINTEKLSA